MDFFNDVVAVMPHLAPAWNLAQSLESIGEVPCRFLLMDNSPTHDTKDMQLHKNIEVEWHPGNLGTSISWNRGLMCGAKWTLILSVSTRFGEGGLKAYLEEAVHWANDFGFQSPIGGHCHAIGREWVKRLGLADPNYAPAYAEDRDWGRRSDASDIPNTGSMPVFRPKGLHIIGSAIAVQSGAVKDQRIPEREAYHFAKWGGAQNQEVFKTPFNDPNNKLSYFPSPEFLKDISADVYENAVKAMDWYEKEFGSTKVNS